MTVVVTLIALAALAAASVFLWKSGFLFDAEHPLPKIETPVKNSKERDAALRRISRWRSEGKISREEADHWERLCEEEWDLRG